MIREPNEGRIWNMWTFDIWVIVVFYVGAAVFVKAIVVDAVCANAGAASPVG